MDKRAVNWVLVCVPLLVIACGLTTPATRVGTGEAGAGALATQEASATDTLRPTSTEAPASPTQVSVPPPATDTPVAVQPTASATAVPPSPAAAPTIPVPETFVVEEEQHIGGYIIQLWRNTAEDGWGFDNVATISTGGETQARIEGASAIGAHTGIDITGEGHPDVIIETYTGGAHCCFGTIVYDLGPTLTKVLDSPQSNCAGYFEDLNGDSALEFVTCDDLFAYTYCPYAASPVVTAILQYTPGDGFVAASPSFGHQYEDQFVRHREMAEGAEPGEFGEWDGTTKCAVLPLVLDHLYSGQTVQAWTELDRLYEHPDKALFWAEIENGVGGSSLYVSSGPGPDVPFPPYYMLQLLTSCGPERQHVGFLTEGQDACEAMIPYRDVPWLDWELREIGLLASGERLELAPEGCGLNCRLDIISAADQSRTGSIRLDTSGSFPGSVYRVNGVESSRWRLRGDLTWEEASP